MKPVSYMVGATGIEPAWSPLKRRVQSQRLLHSRDGGLDGARTRDFRLDKPTL